MIKSAIDDYKSADWINKDNHDFTLKIKRTSHSTTNINLSTLRMSPYSDYLALLHSNHSISIHDIWKLHSGDVQLPISNDNNSANLDTKQSFLKKYKPQLNTQIYDIKFHPKQNLLIASTNDNTILFHNYLQPKRFNKYNKLIKHSAPIEKFEFIGKGDEFVFYSNNYLFSFDLNSNKITSSSNKPFLKYNNSFKGVYDIKYITGTNYTMTLHYDNYVRVWDNRTLKVVKEYYIPITLNKLPYKLTFNFNSKKDIMVVSTAKQSSMSLFDLRADCMKEFSFTNKESNIKELKFPFPINIKRSKESLNDVWLVGTRLGFICVDDKLDVKFEKACYSSPIVDMCWGETKNTLTTISEQNELSTWYLSAL